MLGRVDGTAESWSEQTGELLQAKVRVDVITSFLDKHDNILVPVLTWHMFLQVLVERFNVTSMPSLFVLRNGQPPRAYRGPRNSGEAIADYMVTLQQPPSVLVSGGRRGGTAGRSVCGIRTLRAGLSAALR